MTEPTSRARTAAGLLPRPVVAALLLVACACWMVWATRTLTAVRDRRVVSVALSTLVQDYVTAQAHAAGSADQSAARTRAYLAALDRAVAEEARGGTVVLAAEATLGRSVPDRTAAVRRRVARLLEAGGGER